MNIMPENNRNSFACDLKIDSSTINNRNMLPNETVNSHNVCTTDFIWSGACSYENPNPTGLNRISPTVMTTYCDNCHKIWIVFFGVASI